jgi:hypothetical protein
LGYGFGGAQGIKKLPGHMVDRVSPCFIHFSDELFLVMNSKHDFQVLTEMTMTICQKMQIVTAHFIPGFALHWDYFLLIDLLWC